MSKDITPLASLAHRPSVDLIATGAILLVTKFFEFLPHLIQLLAAAVFVITFWEKPTVQGWVTRLRTYLAERNNDASG